jgi:hypothetical protein
VLAAIENVPIATYEAKYPSAQDWNARNENGDLVRFVLDIARMQESPRHQHRCAARHCIATIN